jgi:hypothetical protein
MKTLKRFMGATLAVALFLATPLGGQTVEKSRSYVTRLLAGVGTNLAPSITFASDPTKGFYSSGVNAIGVAMGGGELFRMSTSGLSIASDVIGLRLGSGFDTTLIRGGAAGKLVLGGTTPMLQLGGTTASFPALKQSGVNILLRLADDSASTTIFGKFGTFNMLLSDGSPSISSGFGTSPSVINHNGPAAFRVNVGTGGVATTGVIALPTATTGWSCFVNDQTTNVATRQNGTTTTTATFIAASAWAASDILNFSCFAY